MKKQQIRELLTFTSRERSGVIVLSILLVGSIVVAYVLPNLSTKTHNLSAFDDRIYEFQASLKEKPAESEFQYKFQSEEKHTARQIFTPSSFDPNVVSESNLASMGFNKSQIKNLLNYRNSGGSFYNKKDFLKLYTIDSSIYNQFKSYITIADKAKVFDPDKKTGPDEEIEFIIPIEMNSCSEDELVNKLKISSYMAQRIIKYRNLLGGFVDYSQLADVYGFDKCNFDTSRVKISFDPELIQKIDLNTSDFKDIISHPYIDKYTTNAILEYRKYMKSIKSMNELVENKVLTKEDMLKIGPYIQLQ